MASENNLNAVFTDIANAIRDKKGSVDTIKPVNMADEILTIGDTNFKDLVERTITSVDDDTITTIGAYAFYNCKNLTTADFKSATNVFQYAFEGCSSLLNVNFTNLINIKWNVFLNCSSLTTLILRTNQVCTLSNTNTFNGTPIATSTTEGYIYVPLSLVEGYRDATNWITYKNKIMPIDLLEGNYVEVDLGTLNWEYNSGHLYFQTSSLKNVISTPTNNGRVGNIIANGYGTTTFNTIYGDNSIDMIISQTSDNGLVQVRNLSYTDPTAFKNAIKGTILRYLPKE